MKPQQGLGERQEEIFSLVQVNMEALYNSSFEASQNADWKWDAERKREELSHDQARYLVVSRGSDALLGFAAIRFEVEFGSDVAYIYEVQVNLARESF